MVAMRRYSPDQLVGVLLGYGFKPFNGYRDPELDKNTKIILSPNDEIIVIVIPDEASDDYVPEQIINDICEEYNVSRFLTTH